MLATPLNVGDMEKYYLLPGEIFSSKKSHIVDTILGSCVAVFLWDPLLQFGSINHFMLPLCSKEGALSFKYGNLAIPELIKRMLRMGSSKNNLKAKIFGGSEIGRSNPVFNIGERNIILARTLLNKEKIPIVSHSVGGNRGRKVVFYSASGEVFVSYIRQGINGVTDKEISLYNPNITGK